MTRKKNPDTILQYLEKHGEDIVRVTKGLSGRNEGTYVVRRD